MLLGDQALKSVSESLRIPSRHQQTIGIIFDDNPAGFLVGGYDRKTTGDGLNHCTGQK